jgi:hypothetical protein
MAEPLKLTWSDGDCAEAADAIKAEVTGNIQAAFSRAGFVALTDPAAKHDAVARSSLVLSYCGQNGRRGMITMAVEPGATVSGGYSDRFWLGHTDAPWWDTVLVRKLQEAPQIQALKTPGPGEAQMAAASAAQPSSVPGPGTRRAGTTPPTQPPTTDSDFAAGAAQANLYALVVGIERYRDVPGATGANGDARAFARLARQTLGVAESNIRLLLDDRASRSDVMKELAWLAGNVPEGGRIVFYFSGHGAPDASNGTPYVVPFDGDPRALTTTAIPLADVLKKLGETKAREVLAITDACFAGAGGRSVLPPGARPLTRVRETPTAARVAVFASAGGSEISGPPVGGTGGLFTRVLAEGLGSGQADIDGDGSISLRELREWVAPRVAREARRDNREQTPVVTVGRGTSEQAFVLAHGVTRHR